MRKDNHNTTICKKCYHWKNGNSMISSGKNFKRCGKGNIVKNTTRACFQFWPIKKPIDQKYSRRKNATSS